MTSTNPDIVLVEAARCLLQESGDDHKREGLQETPARFAKAFRHWMQGYNQDPADVLKTFEDGAEGYDQMIWQKDIPVWSHCEHHIAPFFGLAHIAYIPDKKIVGLSKMTRLTDVFARRLQVQERLTAQVAEAFNEHVQPKGVGVVLQCRHSCIESRGVQKAGTMTVTSALRGVFEKADVKAEFAQLLDIRRI